MTIYNPQIIIYQRCHSNEYKPEITPSLDEIRQMDPDIVIYPFQRLLFVLYNPRVVKDETIPLRMNICKMTHILAIIDKYERFSYDLPQRYFVYDFLLTDPILSNYIF